ncbi:MAG: hypothetical protein LBM64_01130 [Deltaproteobacteria bacterium]|jgi:hypothetical protein|nr:hypothetical protein [Deltaproteobacteria bacterium]
MSLDGVSGDSPFLRQLESFVPGVLSGRRLEAGGRTLGSLSEGLAGYVPPPTIQKRDDLIELAVGKSGALLGAGEARALEGALAESFTALTANHHAINTLPEFIQGILIFALRQLAGDRRRAGGAIAVFSAGGVPMSDLTFPGGILLGRPKRDDSTTGVRLRLFKPKARKTLVNRHPGFSAADVAKARAQVPGGQWRGYEQAALADIVDHFLNDPQVLALKPFSQQCTVINAKLWPRMFRPGLPVPPLVMLDKLELERDLLLADLRNENSLAYALLFDPGLRDIIARCMNGDRACWTCRSLDDGSAPTRGSLFFWGIDREGRMFPLSLDQDKGRLFSARYPAFTLELTPGAVERALRENSILPGLYLGFTAMALARGLMCCGGIFQTGYLRRIRNGTAAGLAAAGYGGMAARLKALTDAPLTSGMLPLGFVNGLDPPYAAGGVELLAAGGLSAGQLAALRDMTLSRALASSFPYLYELAVPSGERLPGWQESLRSEYGVELFPAGQAAPGK